MSLDLWALKSYIDFDFEFDYWMPKKGGRLIGGRKIGVRL